MILQVYEISDWKKVGFAKQTQKAVINLEMSILNEKPESSTTTQIEENSVK